MNASALKRVGAVVAAAATLGMFAACTPAPDYPPVLAVAYSNLDGVDGFHAGQDMLIARLVDTNRDGAASAGDTVELGRYPTDLAASGFGNFANTKFVATSVTFLDPNQVVVNIGADHAFIWASFSPGLDAFGEGWNQTTVPEDHLVEDWHFPSTNLDNIEVFSSSPSGPDTAVPYTALSSATDDPFIDVDIYV